MKKLFFSFVMLVTLVIVAGSAKAINEKTVLPGGKYTYVLSGVSSAYNATASVTYSGTGATINQIGGSYAIVGGATATSVTFEITYGSQSSPASSGTISVTITDGTSNCVNSIALKITVAPMPTYTLTIAANTTGYSDCQARTGAGDNLTDARGTEANSFTYTVTPVVNNVSGNFTYSYKIALPTNTELTSFNNGGSGVAAYNSTTGVVTHSNVSSVTPDTFTITFITTTGKTTQTITATLDNTASTLVPVDGGGTYVSTIASGGNNTQSVTVKAVPTIGSFQ